MSGRWLFLLLAGLVAACSDPCDELVEKRCACGPKACRAARAEVKLEMELFKSLGGADAKRALSERCRARVAAVACDGPGLPGGASGGGSSSLP
jgi:hypothetical protein